MYESLKILSLSVHRLTFDQSVKQVMSWGLQHTPSYVCFANVHMTIEADNDPAFLEQLDKASLVLADGKPVALACKLLHRIKQERISGMDFMPRILQAAHEAKATVFLYGSTNEVLNALREKIAAKFPGVVFGGAISPPFGKSMDADLLGIHIEEINRSGANIVLVALGCPKQEKWMSANYSRINAVLLGVGGAFPVMAGLQRRSPKWMQDCSLEWLYRLIQEPRRMFKRYLYTNTRFLWLLSIAWLKKKMR